MLFKFCSWFFEHWRQGFNLSRTRPFFIRAKSDTVCLCGLSVGHGYLSMAVLILIYRSHSYRWAAVWPGKSRTTSSNIHTACGIRYVALKTGQRRWTIGRSGERGSGISVLAARHDDDDTQIVRKFFFRWSCMAMSKTRNKFSLFKTFSSIQICFKRMRYYSFSTLLFLLMSTNWRISSFFKSDYLLIVDLKLKWILKSENLTYCHTNFCTVSIKLRWSQETTGWILRLLFPGNQLNSWQYCVWKDSQTRNGKKVSSF